MKRTKKHTSLVPVPRFPDINTVYQHKEKRNSCKGLLTPEIIEETQELVGLLGLRQEDLAEYFDVNVTTIENWAKKNADFRKALRIGRIIYGLKVAKAMCVKAVGFTMPDTQIMQYKGEVIKVPYLKYYPPDPYAGNKYLSVIFRETWADSVNVKHEHSGTINHRKIEDLPLEELSKEERDLIFSLGMKQLNSPSKN